MALGLEQQISEAVKKSSSILITFRKKFDADSVASACALALFLKKMNKAVEIIGDDFLLPPTLDFLPLGSAILPQLGIMQKLVISINLKDKAVDHLNYEVKDGTLSIYIAPKQGVLEKENVKTDLTGFKYDLIFVLDTPDLESLGKLFEQNTELFFAQPIINIDYHPANENFGQIQLHDLIAASVSEMLFRLFMQIGKELIDAPIALCLLTGLIARTKSFSTANVTPTTLETAKALIELGADRNLVIKNLYRNKALAVINLWGRVLARLRYDQATRLGWTLIPEYDFIDTSTTEKNLDGVVEEFIRDVPQMEAFVIFYQRGPDIHAQVHSLGQHDALWLTQTYKPEGTRHLATFTLAHLGLIEAEKKVTEDMKNRLKQSLRD